MFGAQFAAPLTVRGIVTLIGLSAVGVLIWFGGPCLDLFGRYPLQSVTVRAATIAGVFLATMLVILVRGWLARPANRRAIMSLMESEGLVSSSSDRSREKVELIRRRFEHAFKVLRDTVFAGKRGPRYLFELPWYIVIGPPGAGKTTILRNSGLGFPLTERLGVDPVAGVGGTRNCDWWFTDEAVFIDTASRHMTKDKDTEVDRAAWSGFLDFLTKHRREPPINGVLVAISLSDLLLSDNNRRRRLVGSIRSRIQELLKKCGGPIPVYVLVTKCDLVSGFAEYFDNLDQEGRAQVWGRTFPLDAPRDHISDVVTLEIQELAERLESKLAFRMQEERNLSRRLVMYAFPKEFWSTRTAITGFVSEVFRMSRFEVRPMLRGIYFTSGAQEGAPIGRVNGAISRSFGLHSAPPSSSIGPGKAFFIKRLLSDVIFAEQGLIGRNLRLEGKLALLHGCFYIAAITLAVAALAQWYGAFARSEVRISETRIAVQTLQAHLQEIHEPLDLKKLLPILNAARRLPQAAREGTWYAWLEDFGISATLAPAAQEAYDHILVDRLLPVFASRLAVRIEASLRSGNDTLLDEAKEAFRTYLMLSNPRRFNRGRIEQAALTEVALAFGLDATSSGELKEHFSRLIELLPKPITTDQKFVIAVGSQLMERRPLVEQVYIRLLREAAQDTKLRPIDLVSLLGSGELEMRAPQIVSPAILQHDPSSSSNGAVIPGIFTRDGFLEFLPHRLPLFIKEEQSDDWILAGDPLDAADTQQLALKVIDRYVDDYIRTWTRALSNIRVVKFDDMQRGGVILRRLAGSQSALLQIISLVRDHTSLPLSGEMTSAKTGAAASAAFSAAFGEAPWPGARITEAFRPLAKLATAEVPGQPAGLDQIRDRFGGLYATMANIASAPDPGRTALQLVQRRAKDPNGDSFGALHADSALRPELVRTIMNDVALSTWSILLKQAHGYVNAVWVGEVFPLCAAAIFQRYPMYAAATEDITLKDFSDLFRPGGVLDDFFRRYLSPLVLQSRNGLALATIDGAELPIHANALAQFQRAQEIRKSFFSGPGSGPAVKLSIKPVYLASHLRRATFAMDGKEIFYRHEAPRSYDLEWPSRTEASTTSITLTALDGTEEKIESSGPWALFRLVGAPRLSSRGNSNRFTIGGPDRPSVTYELRAESKSNPFSSNVLRSFRCPNNL
ncbi:type VI secretion system membrane subunit TssM [Bradyrhizobium pachyrhizi]|uniref:type VI secretion system membrane subunit TssM n=1 Tax=Bradyrhizobium pachyrhizi TaxID=280333 RepID=UPI0024B222A9|nr:type VI secretion system membrane subunit TssM [Bradyrhizobium pachyrhizi]WFU54622.1 type VI secretion system membrane subunit TssM [Bradyrhizobium pachyrhizi]